MSVKVDPLIECSCETIGEGPHWDDRTDTLLYVDIDSGYIHRWNSQTNVDERHGFGDVPVSFMIPRRKGGVVIGLGSSVAHFDWDSKELTTLHETGVENTRFNDAKCDASGRLWCGTMAMETGPAQVEHGRGALYSLELDGSLKKRKEGVSISNGMAWSADNKTMYYIDSVPRKVMAYDFDLETGTMSNERVAVDFGEWTQPTHVLPDGMTIDCDQKLWVACYSGGKVVRFDPETGKEISRVDIPARRTTSCCFGGKDLDTLIVSTAVKGVVGEEKKQTPLAGSIFKVTGLGGVKGFKPYIYEG